MEDAKRLNSLTSTLPISSERVGCAVENERTTVAQSQEPEKKLTFPSVVSLLNDGDDFRPRLKISSSEIVPNKSAPPHGSSQTPNSFPEPPITTPKSTFDTSISWSPVVEEIDQGIQSASLSQQVKDHASSDADTSICPFFLQGSCKYGTQCELLHSAAKTHVAESSSHERPSAVPQGHQPHHHFYHSSRSTLRRSSPSSSKSVQGNLYTFSLDKIPSSSSRSPQSSGNFTTPATGGGSLLKPFACTMCDRTFNRLHNLKSHMATHSVERPYQCDKCLQSFRRLHDLKRHQRMHTGVKPFQCPVCMRQFSRQDALNRHQKTDGVISCNAKQINRKTIPNTVDKLAGAVTPVERQMSPADNTDGANTRRQAITEGGQETTTMEIDHAEKDAVAHTAGQEDAELSPDPKITTTQEVDQQLQTEHEERSTSTIGVPPSRKSSSSLPDKSIMTIFSVQPDTRSSKSPSPGATTKKTTATMVNSDNDQRQQNLMPHFCPTCLISFGRRQELKRHMGIHAKNGKFYSCDICTKQFSRRDALLRHRRTMHNNQELQPRTTGKAEGSMKQENDSKASSETGSFKVRIQRFQQKVEKKPTNIERTILDQPTEVLERSETPTLPTYDRDRPPIPPLSVTSCRDTASYLLDKNASLQSPFSACHAESSHTISTPNQNRGLEHLVHDFLSNDSMSFPKEDSAVTPGFKAPSARNSSLYPHPYPSYSIPTSTISPREATPSSTDSPAELYQKIFDLMKELEQAKSTIERHRRKNRDLIVENRVLKSVIKDGKSKRRRSSSPQSTHSNSDMMDTDEDA
ncbi:hypothetical protein EC973_005604 [Apophysomyces ossiformis]|uniref:Uncharacterized protein n=1 Tax=Apophysomyces ossiformis TaxID=679940 RepID=A0A8H7BWT1_9FUNG|nr:hypothetical protein EC973_005604 [Apophysomyces ossiformis]